MIQRTMLKKLMLAGMVMLTAAGCEEEDLTLPTQNEIESYFAEQDVEVELTGNVVLITVVQSATQLRRGGSLWAKVGPYIYLFSEPTHQLLVDHPGVAGVRVITRTSGGTRVASVLLRRDALNDINWRRALNMAGLARRDGSTQITRLGDLVRWGEERTEFEYSSRWVN